MATCGLTALGRQAFDPTLSTVLALEEGGEGRAGERGEALLQGLDLCVARLHPDVEVLDHVVAGVVDVEILLHELLEVGDLLVPRGLLRDLVLLLLRVRLGLRGDVLLERDDRLIGVVREVLVRLLGGRSAVRASASIALASSMIPWIM